jgi:hypothetical protein
MVADVRHTLIQVFKTLKEAYKTELQDRAVTLEFKPLDETNFPLMAVTEEMDNKYIIKINSKELNNNYTCWLHILIHEFAHVMAGWSNKNIHTNKWGIWYARIYRKVVDEQ